MHSISANYNSRIKSRLCQCALLLDGETRNTHGNKFSKSSQMFRRFYNRVWPTTHQQHTSPWEWRSVERCVSLQCLVTSSSCCVAVSLGLSELQISRDYQRSPGTMGTLASNKTQTRFPRISGLCCFLEKTKAHFLTEKAAVRIIDYRWGHWHCCSI